MPKMMPDDPAYWMLSRGHTSPKPVHRPGCYICEDPEFAQMGMSVCQPCPQCSAEHKAENPEMENHNAGHVPADDVVCSDCGYDVQENREMSLPSQD